METWNAPSPEIIAQQHSSEILSAVAQEFSLAIGDLQILPQGSFVSDDGSVSFYVRHPTGLYGVNAYPARDGTIQNITAGNLQMTDYFDPPKSPDTDGE